MSRVRRAHQEMSPGMLAGLVGGAAALVGGVAYAASSPSSALTPSSSAGSCPPLPPVGSGSWVQATQVNPGDNVRITMDPTTLQTVAQSQGVTADASGWTQILSSTAVANVFGTPATSTTPAQFCVTAWAPGQALPTDWPSDDSSASTGYHAQFLYQGTAALSSSQMPLPVTVWTLQPSTWGGQVPQPTTSSTGGGFSNYHPGGTSGGSSAGGLSASAIAKAATVFTKPATSTSPRTADLVPPAAGQSQPAPISLTGVAPGTPIWVAIDGGGTFTTIDSTLYGPSGSSYAESGYPLAVLPTVPLWLYTTSAASGELAVTWTDAASSASYETAITYGP